MKTILGSIFLASFLLLAANAHAQVIIIANPSVKANDITKGDIRDIFLGAVATLRDGTKVVPILLNGGTQNEEFLKAYIGKTDSAYRATWRSLVFSGQKTMPKSLEDDAAVVTFVAAHPGSVGYINENSPHAGVKVLTVK
jgi:ABC-type phosphate transport system substrate-binding protein